MASYADIIKKRKKDWACPDLMDSVNKVSGEKIPFSSPSLNYIVYGGIPKIGLTQFYGYEGSGKSTSAMDLCKNALEVFSQDYNKELQEVQEKIAAGKKEYKVTLSDLEERGPKKVLYVDVEHSYNRKWADTLGITSSVDVMQPPNVAGEEILQTIMEIAESGETGLIVLDSVPSLIPRTELEKKIGERTVAALAGMMTEFCRKINPVLFRGKCALILINQQRENMDNPYKDRVPGGRAIAFYSMLTLAFKLGTPVDFLGNELKLSAENPAGYEIDVYVKKQKTAPFDRKHGQYYLMAQSGLRVDFEFVNLAITRYEIIRKGGAWFTICDPKTKEPLEVDGNIVKINGLAKVYDYVQIHPEYYKELCDFIIADINDNGLVVSGEGDDGDEIPD